MESMASCFAEVQLRFTGNGLSLNPDKTEVVVVGTGARHRSKGVVSMIPLGGATISVSASVKSLKVTTDSVMSFNDHVNNLCKAS
jgi:hypothetical protein